VPDTLTPEPNEGDRALHQHFGSGNEGERTLIPEQVEAIRERFDQPQNYDEGSLLRYLALERSADDVLALLADHDALTAEVGRLRESAEAARHVTRMEERRAEAAERKVAAVRAGHLRRPWRSGDFVEFGQSDFPDICDHDHNTWPCETIRALDGEAS